MSASVDVLAMIDSLIDTTELPHGARMLGEIHTAVAELIEALREAHYCGLLIGSDCAWALAKLQREGVYKPTCSDGKPSRADASRDLEKIDACRAKTRVALARVGVAA